MVVHLETKTDRFLSFETSLVEVRTASVSKPKKKTFFSKSQTSKVFSS